MCTIARFEEQKTWIEPLTYVTKRYVFFVCVIKFISSQPTSTLMVSHCSTENHAYLNKEFLYCTKCYFLAYFLFKKTNQVYKHLRQGKSKQQLKKLVIRVLHLVCNTYLDINNLTFFHFTPNCVKMKVMSATLHRVNTICSSSSKYKLRRSMVLNFRYSLSLSVSRLWKYINKYAEHAMVYNSFLYWLCNLHLCHIDMESSHHQTFLFHRMSLH